MENANKHLLSIAVIALTIAQIISYSTISNLKSQVSRLQDQIYSGDENIQSQINAIYNNVDDMLEEQASVIASYDIVYGDFDVDNATVELSLNATPKTLSDSTKMYMDIDSEAFEMTRSGDVFTFETEASIEKGLKGRFIVETDGVKQVESTQLSVNTLDYALPSLHPMPIISSTSSANGGDFKASANATVSFSTSKSGATFVSAEHVVTVDGEQHTTTPVPFSELHKAFNEDFDISVPVTDGQVVKGYFSAVDSYGFTHAFETLHHLEGSDSQPEPHFFSVQIFDRQGNLIINEDELGYTFEVIG